MSRLNEILLHKEAEVRERGLRERDWTALLQLAPPPRGFARALQTASTSPALIAEVKRASPSQGVIRQDFDPVLVAQTYQETGAACLSVLTDEQFFGGADRNLVVCREATALPALRKDFVIDASQVRESRCLGADAILLIVAALSDAQIRQFHQIATDLGMDALVEVHDVEEANRAVQCGATLIGVNNRNLHDFSVDLATTERVFSILPSEVMKVSESGLGTRQDVLRVRDAGADAVLIGTTFCRATNIGEKVQELMTT